MALFSLFLYYFFSWYPCTHLVDWQYKSKYLWSIKTHGQSCVLYVTIITSRNRVDPIICNWMVVHVWFSCLKPDTMFHWLLTFTFCDTSSLFYYLKVFVCFFSEICFPLKLIDVFVIHQWVIAGLQNIWFYSYSRPYLVILI